MKIPFDDVPNVGEADQATSLYCDLVVNKYASIFRAFCNQDGISRAEALSMTQTIISSRETTGLLLMEQRRKEAEAKERPCL